jgi:hypothetical protein
MAFQFPPNPAMGQLFNPAPGVIYKWSGVGWTPFSTAILGLQAFTQPVLFADGTLATPGIAWSSDIDTGFLHVSGGMQAVVDAVAVFGWSAGAVTSTVATNLQSSLNVGGNTYMTGSLNASHVHSRSDVVAAANMSTAGTHYTGALSVSGGASFNDGLETYGGAGGVSYANVNACTNNSHRIAFGWRSDGALGLRVGGSQYNSTWPINITGNCNYANSAGSTPTASNANAVNNISGWSYSNASNGPTWLWASDGSTGHQFLCHRASMSVNYANTCDRSNSSGYADNAGYANNAGNANSVGGVGMGNIVRSNNGTVYSLRMWQDGNDKVFMEICAPYNIGPTNCYNIGLWDYGPTNALGETVRLLTERVAALEAAL